MAVAPARRVALKLVGECRRRSARMRDLLRSSDELVALDARDRALAFRLAMGVAATQGSLDQMIDAHLRKPRSLEPKVRDALRVAAFEVVWMNTPRQVAVSQGVEMVRHVSQRAAGLANAVLRRIAEGDRARVEGARARCADGTAVPADLSLTSAVPSWLVEELVCSRGMDGAAAMLASRLEPSLTLVGTNLARFSEDETRALLEREGLEPEPCGLPRAFLLGNPAGLGASGLVEDGSIVVADAAAQLVCELVCPKPGEHVLEIGQGRGTKSVLLQSAAMAQGGGCHMVSVDSEDFKVRLAARRMERAGLSQRVSCVCFDGRRLADDELPAELDRTFDLVFLDAPCSGVGTMRRHVEIPWSLERDVVDGSSPTGLPALQLQLLKAASARVREGGMLCYSTCSALVQEDEAVVEAFLASGEGRSFCQVSALSRAGEESARELASLTGCRVGEDGSLLTGLAKSELGLLDTHFLAMLERRL